MHDCFHQMKIDKVDLIPNKMKHNYQTHTKFQSTPFSNQLIWSSFTLFWLKIIFVIMQHMLCMNDQPTNQNSLTSNIVWLLLIIIDQCSIRQFGKEIEVFPINTIKLAIMFELVLSDRSKSNMLKLAAPNYVYTYLLAFDMKTDLSLCLCLVLNVVNGFRVYLTL